MKIILTTDVPNLGGPGDTVEVKDGYGRNFLLPRGLAVLATRGAEKQVAILRRSQETKQIRDLEHAREVASQLTGLGTVALAAKAGRSGGKLFGSITAADVVGAFRAAGGPPVDRRTVELSTTIKSTGKYSVIVRLHPEVSVTVPVEVSAQG